MVRDGAVVIVLLRDPVERFESAMRHRESLPDFPGDHDREGLRSWVPGVVSDAQWAGMYATHLQPWAATFGRERLHVFQYEKVRLDPQRAVDEVWRALGCNPMPLSDVDTLSATTSDRSRPWRWDQLPQLRERLVELYRPEVDHLVRDWGIDRVLWPNFR